MNARRIVISMLLAVTLSTAAHAQGVELNPAYITGTVSLTNAVYADKVYLAYVYAYADGGFSANTTVAADGTYTLTVNAPADGTERAYTVYARFYLKNGIEFSTAEQSVVVTKDATEHADFSAALGTLTLNLSATNGNISSLNFLIFNSSGYPYLYASLYVNLSPPVSSTQYSVDFPAGIEAYYVWAYVYPADSAYTQVLLETQDFIVNPGETVEQTYSATFPEAPKKATLQGTITLDGIPGSLEFDHHWMFYPYIYLYTNGGSYTTDDATPGTQTMYLYTYFKNNTYMAWPYKSIVPDSDYARITILPGQVNTFSPRTSLAGVLSGSLKFTGVASLADVPEYYRGISLIGKSSSDAYGGYTWQSYLNPNTGDFSLPATAGTWTYDGLSYFAFQKNLTDPDNYVNCSIYGISDIRGTADYTISQGQSIQGISIEIPTGSVKIKFSVTDGSLVASPGLSFSFNQVDASGQTMFYGSGSASGPSQALIENQSTIVGPPGTYTVNASALVNGSWVTFNPQQVIVIEGVEQVLEINGPSLSVSSPQAELYTYDDQVTVSGIADDDTLVASVTVNDAVQTLTSTNNPERPKEVSFSTPFTLANGPNKIVVKAVDSAGKIAQDTRFVYKDRGAPTLSFKPVTSTTNATTITVEGTTSDDNAITKVFVNGLAVPFSWSGNANDPNEVSFTTELSLKDGPNTISVIVEDNCKRTTSEAHIVTRAEKDETPPVFPALADVVLEQAGPEGTAYVLPVPNVTDDQDPAPTVASNAPAVFPAGLTTVTWTATDASGNSSTAAQKVTVADTTPPSITAPADVVLEYTGGPASGASIGYPVVHDAVDPSPNVTADLPSVFPLGVTSVTWTATDHSGNSASAVQKVTAVDTTPPATTLSLGDPKVVKNGIQYISDKTPITLSAVDIGSGVAAIYYNLGAGPSLYSGPITIAAAGACNLRYYAVDAAGNREPEKSVSVTVDNKGPEITVEGVAAGMVYKNAVTPVIKVVDPILDSSSVTLNGAAYTQGTPIEQNGQYTLAVAAIDLLGNTSSYAVSFAIAKSSVEMPGYYFLENDKVKIYWQGAAGAVGYNIYLNGKKVNKGFHMKWPRLDREDHLVKDTSYILHGIHGRNVIAVKAVGKRGMEIATAAQFSIDQAQSLFLSAPQFSQWHSPKGSSLVVHGSNPFHRDVKAYYAVIDEHGYRTAWISLGPVTQESRNRFSFSVPVTDQIRGKQLALRVTGWDARQGREEETGMTIRIAKK